MKKTKKTQKVKLVKGADTVICTFQLIALANGGLAIQLVEKDKSDQ